MLLSQTYNPIYYEPFIPIKSTYILAIYSSLLVRRPLSKIITIYDENLDMENR